MGISRLDERYRVNGVIDTRRPVLENLTDLCNSCGSWLTYDNELGRWGVIINQAGASTRSFDESTIIGNIEVQGVGLRDLYNSVTASFPRKDIQGQRDFVNITIDPALRSQGEVDNVLEIEYNLVDDPIQAELLAFIELKQSRINTSIRFRCDYSQVGVKAGDVIDVTVPNYGFDQRLFRVITVREIQDDDGGLVLDILAMGYDSAVYDEDFTLYERSNQDGIVTIGAIGAPAIPQISKIEVDRQPRLIYEAAAPTGIVEEIEFWTSSDNSNYKLVASLPPVNGGVYALGEEITYIDLDVPAGDIYLIVRGKNSTTVGPFSSHASALFAPRQVTDVIGPDTVAQDGLGNILTTLALIELLSRLDDLFDGVTSAGSVFDKVFDILFDENGGVDVRDPTVMGPLGELSGKQVMVLAAAGKTTKSLLPQTTGAGAIMHTITFEAPITGVYKIDSIIDQNNSGAQGGRGTGPIKPGTGQPYWDEPVDNVLVYFDCFGPDDGYTTPIAGSISGGTGAFSWTDFVLTDTVSLVAGDSYQLKFGYVQQTESDDTATASFDISWNVYTIDTLAP